MRLCQNMNSLSIYNRYKKNLTENSTAIERISSGLKINSAKDNPNKIGQSESMRIKLKSLQSAEKNLQDGVSMIQAADGALQSVNDTLIRIRELTVSAADGSKTADDRRIIQSEIDELKNNINDIAKNTEFNGVKLIGDENVISNKLPSYKPIVVGAMAGEQGRIPTYNVTIGNLKDNKGNSIEDINVIDNISASKATSTVDDVINVVSSIRSKLGAIQGSFENMAQNLGDNMNTLQEAESNLRDADIALEMADLAKTQILNDTAIALMRQSNKLPQESLQILQRLT